MSPKDFVSCIFSLTTAVTTWDLESGKLQELFHGNKLDSGIQHAAKSPSSFLLIERWLPNTKQKKHMLGFCSGKKSILLDQVMVILHTLASVPPGCEYWNPSFNNLMPFLKENIRTTYM